MAAPLYKAAERGIGPEYARRLLTTFPTADPFWLQSDGQSWKHEKATISLVADFVSSLPSE